MVGLDVMVAPLICTLHNTHSSAHGTFTNALLIQRLYVYQKSRGPSGPRRLDSGPSGLLDNVLHALQALRPCDPRNGAMILLQICLLLICPVPNCPIIYLLICSLLFQEEDEEQKEGSGCCLMDGYWHNNTTAGSALLRKPILLLFITVMMNTLFKVVNSPEEIEEKTKAASLAVEAKCFPCFTCSPDLF